MNITLQKVICAIEAFQLFLNVIEKDTGTIQEGCLSLLTELQAGKIEDKEGICCLNRLIKECNRSLSTHYPSFSTNNLESFVKEEIVAFEHYLHQELKANHLSIEQEAPLFNDSFALWEKIGIHLSPDEGEAQLDVLIQRLNQLLPENQQYPFLEKK